MTDPKPLPSREASGTLHVLPLAGAPLSMPLPSLDLRDQLRLFWRQRWLIAGTIILSLALTVLALSQITPRYTASAQVMIDPRQANILDMEQVMAGLPSNTETVQSEIEVITSRNLASRVIEALHLKERADFNTAGADASSREVTNQLVQNYLDALDVRAAGRSRVINIAFTAQDPELAAQAANTVAELYLVEQLEAKFEATRRATLWLSTRLDELRIKAEAAELAVTRFKARLSGTAKAADDELLPRLNADILTLTAELEDARKKLVQLQLLKERGKTDLNNTQLTSALQKIAVALEDTEQEITDQSQELGPRHPKMIELNQRRSDLRSQYSNQLSTEIQTLQRTIRENEQKLVSLQADLARLSNDINDPNAAAVRLRTLERDAQATRALYETVLTRFKQTTEQQGLEQADARLISRADVPLTPSFPQNRLFLLLALLGGTALAVVLALAAEKLDSGFRSAEQLESWLGLPTLATLPSLRSLGVKTVAPEVYIAQKPTSSFAEAVRMLRTALQLANPDQPPRVLMVASALPGEGKTTTAMALARLASLSGERVIVVDADLRRPRIHQTLNVENSAGLVDLLTGQASIEQVLRVSEIDGKSVHYLTAGQATPQATELIRSPQMKRLVQSLAANFSLVILDGPPVLPVADAKVLSTLVDRILYVVRWHSTRREVAAQAVKQLREVGGNIAGVVLNGVDVRKQADYSDSGYYYGRYRHYYAD